MPDNGYNVSPVVLPSLMGTPGDALSQQIEYNQRNQLRQDEQQKQNRLFNLRQINDLTDFDKYKTGEQALDAYSQKELGGIFNNAATNYTNLDPAEMEFRLKHDMQGFINWHNAATSQSNDIKSNLADFNKTYPNADLEKAHQIAYTNFANDFIDPKTGQRRDPAFINMDRNYVGELHDPEVLSQITNDISPLQKYYSSSAKQPFHGSDFTNIKGVKNRDKFSGVFSPDKQEIVANDQGDPTLDVKHEIVPSATKNGQPLKIIDQNQFQNITQNPQVFSAALRKWKLDTSPEGQSQIEAKYAANNNGQPMDETFKTVAFKHWLYEDAKRNLDTYISKDKAEVIPRTTINNITNKTPTVNDVYDKIDSTMAANEKNGQTFTPVSLLPQDAKEVVMETAAKSTGNKFITQDDLKLVRGNDGSLRIFGKDNNFISYLDKTSSNLKAKQPGIGEKREIIKAGNPQQQTTTPTKKEINESDIPAKASAAGYTEKEYRTLLQQKGIKIKK